MNLIELVATAYERAGSELAARGIKDDWKLRALANDLVEVGIGRTDASREYEWDMLIPTHASTQVEPVIAFLLATHVPQARSAAWSR